MDYKVLLLMDNIYQVVEGRKSYGDFIEGDVIYQGSLSDCNAWLQLNDKNYLR
tara:strand:+ start:19827 stop:19985 length:159 start_codon:yes stop_codon:yes gene_type:complete